MSFVKRIRVLALIASLLFLGACGYELVRDRGISGGEVVSVSLPVFKNRSLEPQVPGFFTEAFSRELAAGGLVQINKAGSDAVLQGTINSVITQISSLSGSGLAVTKAVSVNLGLVLTRPDGTARTWAFSDSETYAANDINLEDFNKRAALQRIAARIARRFHAQLVASHYSP
jgi:outer membrane lipopolysaccharide assembly protein LptE/RlpB